MSVGRTLSASLVTNSQRSRSPASYPSIELIRPEAVDVDEGDGDAALLRAGTSQRGPCSLKEVLTARQSRERVVKGPGDRCRFGRLTELDGDSNRAAVGGGCHRHPEGVVVDVHVLDQGLAGQPTPHQGLDGAAERAALGLGDQPEGRDRSPRGIGARAGRVRDDDHRRRAAQW